MINKGGNTIWEELGPALVHFLLIFLKEVPCTPRNGTQPFGKLPILIPINSWKFYGKPRNEPYGSLGYHFWGAPGNSW